MLSDFSNRCAAAGVPLQCTVALSQLCFDEILFCSVLSNALENALNSQLQLQNPAHAGIRLMLKSADGKLLLSVKNAIDKVPVFAEGLPVTDRDGHGLGTQSIRYITERLGGNCLFSVRDGMFIVQVVLQSG